MGQRTAFLVKRTFWNGDVNVRLVHHQWGIGRVMHHKQGEARATNYILKLE